MSRVHVPRPQRDRIIIPRICHRAFVTSDIFRLHACLEMLYIIQDYTDWTSRLYFGDDYKLLVRILRPTCPICIILCWKSLHSGNVCFSSGVLKLSAHTCADTAVRYIYETIANWKLQPFFVDDYKLSSERYSQHVCGAAIGPGTVGSVISYTGEAHRVTVFLLRIQTRRLRVTSVTTHPE